MSLTDANELVYCYYCWHSDILSRFKVYVKKGFTNRCVCPECKLSLNYTILTEFNIGDKARWLYLNIRRYRGKHFNFYDNIQFDKIKFRLSGYEKQDFWNNWKDIKANYESMGETELKRLYSLLSAKRFNQQSLLSYQDNKINGVNHE